MKKLSLIVNVLESYPVVRRQLLHLGRILTPECELILVDDGSSPSLRETCDTVPKPFDFIFHCTNDRRPWTQPRARNIGAGLSQAPKLLFFDIDHILTQQLIDLCLGYPGDKLHWQRRPGILDEDGRLVTDRSVLSNFGLKSEAPSVHANSFLIRRHLFDRLGGYDERFCGRYGGDDIDFNTRYDQLCTAGLAKPAEIRGEGYYYPDPAYLKEQFHSLRREVMPAPAENLQRPRTRYTVRSLGSPVATVTNHTLQLHNRRVTVPFATRGPVDDSIIQQVWVKDVYGVRNLSWTPAVVVDIGAHLGTFCLMAAEVWPTARIIAAEADSDNAALLRTNLAGHRNVEIVQAAITGEDVTSVRFNRVMDKAHSNSGGGSCVRDEPGSVQTTVAAIAAVKLWQSLNLARCDLLKLDCERSELAILAALATAGILARIRLLVGEWHSADAHEQSRESVIMALRRILQNTHDLDLPAQASGREGYFFATLKEQRSVSSPHQL
jgi:FkbM family methyltransferase